jgi:AMIN domain-containing protein
MKLIRFHLLLVLVSLAAAQTSVNSAEIEKLSVLRSGAEMRVEVVLTAPVQPNVIVARNPDRLVLELPNTWSDNRQQHVPVNLEGLKAVRIGLNSANPPVTRVVVDLEDARPYGISTSGNTVTLRILPATMMADGRRRGAPAPAASGGSLLERLRPRRQEPLPSVADTKGPAPVTPPPPLPPLQFPPNQQKAQTATAAPPPNSKPSAAHPNYGSLQQGTVFPSMGTPGTGTVPRAAGPASAAGFENGSGTRQPNALPATIPEVMTVASGVVSEPSTTQPKTPTGSPNSAAAGPTSASTAQPTVSTARTASAALVSASGSAEQQTPGAVTTAAPSTSSAAQPTHASAETATSTGQQVANAVTLPGPAPTSPTAQPAKPTQAGAATSPKVTPAAIAAPITISPAQAAAGNAAVSNVPAGPPAVRRETSAPAQAVTVSTVPTPASGEPQQAPATVATATPATASLAANVPGSSSPSSVAGAQPPTAPVSQNVSATSTAQPAPLVAEAESSSVPAAVVEATAADAALAVRQPNEEVRMAFKVKYVAAGAVYLDGGRSAGLAEGMKLEVRDVNPSADQPTRLSPRGKVVAELTVTSIADTSSVTDIQNPLRDVKPGDWAYLSSTDTQVLIAQRSLSATRKYPTVISFSEGDPLEEEARAEVPRPPLPEINRARGRFGLDYSGIRSHDGLGMLSSTIGLSVRTDFSRIGGTYWNLSGYWRGRLTSTSAGSQNTLQDLINRTYHLSLTYDNPQSHWVAGVGRLYLPWATSLDTIDGGYFGRRIVPGVILGIFAGSTPDPASWSYNPDRRIGGSFVNFQGGSFDSLRYTSTSGVGISTLKWKVDRPFIFFENGLYYKRILGIYSSVQADSPAGNPAVAALGPGLSRSFLTVRIQPIDRLEFDLNHTYFRDVPTFDPALIGTGLLDKYLFQGYSAGARFEVVKQIWLYSTLGRSNRSGDTSSSLNQLYGITFDRLPWVRVRADAHYSKFASSFGSGAYEALSLSRNFHDNFRWEILAGQQEYVSTLASSSNSHFVTGNLEAPLGAHYYFQGGFTWNRGANLNYEQWLFSVGYRFDTRSSRK